MPVDYKKESKELYYPKDSPSTMTVPEMNFVAARGKGNPNEINGEWQNAISCYIVSLIPLKWVTKETIRLMDALNKAFRLLKDYGGKME